MRHTILLAAALTLSGPSVAQVRPSPGFSGPEALDVGPDVHFTGIAYGTLPDGSFVRFDGLDLELRAPDGGFVAHLGSVPGPVFPSFVRVHPSGGFALAGESSNGNVYRVDLPGGGVTLLANVFFNFDLAWDVDPGLAYVSAALDGFGGGNDVLRLDLVSGATTELAHVDGPSGPIAVDANGDLYYVTQYAGFDFPPPLAEQDLIRWTDAQLDGGVPLTEADATVLARGLDGGSSLSYDAESAYLYLAHVNFAGKPNEVYQLGSDGVLHDAVLTSPTYLSNVEAFGGPGAAILSAHQPADARLWVHNTDFATGRTERALVAPARPVATFDGPPSGQSGPATVTVEGAEPNAFVSVAVWSSQDELDDEQVSDLGWVAPLFTAAPLGQLWRRTQPIRTDGQGRATFTYPQTPSMEGAFLFQTLVYDGGLNPLGSSTHVINE